MGKKNFYNRLLAEAAKHAYLKLRRVSDLVDLGDEETRDQHADNLRAGLDALLEYAKVGKRDMDWSSPLHSKLGRAASDAIFAIRVVMGITSDSGVEEFHTLQLKHDGTINAVFSSLHAIVLGSTPESAIGRQTKVQYQALGGNESLWTDDVVQRMREGRKLGPEPEPEYYKCKHCASFLVSVRQPGLEPERACYCPTPGCLDNSSWSDGQGRPSKFGFTMRRTGRFFDGDQRPLCDARSFFVWAGAAPALDNCGCNFSDCPTCRSEPAPGIKPTDFGSTP